MDEIEEALLAAVYATPADDVPRSIYADWLLERGVPRGELIALQLAVGRGEATAEDEQRAHALVTAHRAAWLGPALSALPLEFELERGFLVAARHLVVHAIALPDDPRWATLERCDRMPPRAAHATLQTLDGASAADVLRLGALPADSPLEKLVWRDAGSVDLETFERAVDAYRRSVLPALRRVALGGGSGREIARWQPENVDWLFADRHLAEVSLPGPVERVADFFGRFDDAALTRLAIDGGYGRIALARLDDGRFALAATGTAAENEAVADALAQLPDGVLATAEFSSRWYDDRWRQQMRAALAAQPDCEISFTG